VWEGFCSDELCPSPKVQEYVTSPEQPVAMAVEVKETGRGAVPDAGDAFAKHVRVHGAVTVMVPLFEQVSPCTEVVMVQV